MNKQELTEAIFCPHRIEIIQFRNGELKPVEFRTFNDERQAKFNFDGLALKECKHMISNWSFSATEVYTTFKLFQNDTLTESITIGAGLQ